jgi:hypothetical protein
VELETTTMRSPMGRSRSSIAASTAIFPDSRCHPECARLVLLSCHRSAGLQPEWTLRSAAVHIQARNHLWQTSVCSLSYARYSHVLCNGEIMQWLACLHDASAAAGATVI